MLLLLLKKERKKEYGDLIGLPHVKEKKRNFEISNNTKGNSAAEKEKKKTEEGMQ